MNHSVIECYLSDTLLFREPKFEILDRSAEPVVGYFSDNIRSFFMKPSYLTDTRASRLSVLSAASDGVMNVNFDGYINNYNTLFTYLSKSANKSVSDKFFNTLEQVYLNQSADATTLNATLIGSSNFTGYVDGSLIISSDKDNLAVKVKSSDSATVPVSVPTYVSFKFKVNNVIQTFKIWMNNSKFYDDYSISIITQVILPIHGRYLIDPSKNLTIINTIINSSTDIFTNIDLEIRRDDHTGNLSYATRYAIKPNTFEFLSFGILYKGRQPSTMYIREQIKERLIATGLAGHDLWEVLFPDLYIVAQFYMIPIWDNFVLKPTGEQWPSIINYSHMRKVIGAVFKDIEPEYIDKNMEVIMNGANDMFIVTLPDKLNINYFSIQKIHPTYTDHLLQDPGYMYMDMHTKEFSVRFNECVSIVLGSETFNDNYIPTTVDGHDYVSFSIGGIEYFILIKDSYPKKEDIV